MLINCTESPLVEWTDTKIASAKEKFGSVVDVNLPKVNDKMTDEDIDLLADTHFEKIMLLLDENLDKSRPDAVFLDELRTLDIRIKERLEEAEVHCVAFEEI